MYIAPNVKDAKAHALQLLSHDANLHGQQRYWVKRASKAPPSVCFLPKNKLNELKPWGRKPQRFTLHAMSRDLWTSHILPFAGQCGSQIWALFTVNQCMLSWSLNVWLTPPRLENWDWLFWRLQALQWTRNGLPAEAQSYYNCHPLPLTRPHAGPLLRAYPNVHWKHRVIFSYYRHPVRERGRLVARYLQLLITTARTCMQTAEMMHCKDLLPLIRAWNTALSELWNDNALPDDVIFWELDIVAMFPNLSRDRVWESIQEILHRPANTTGTWPPFLCH